MHVDYSLEDTLSNAREENIYTKNCFISFQMHYIKMLSFIDRAYCKEILSVTKSEPLFREFSDGQVLKGLYV